MRALKAMAACSGWRKLFTRRISSSSFDPPPLVHSRRVVVTGINSQPPLFLSLFDSEFDCVHEVNGGFGLAGLGLVTPLGCGVETTWKRLVDGACGVRGLTLEDLKMNGFDAETQAHSFDQLTSKVAAIVPTGTYSGEFNEDLWLNSKVINVIWTFLVVKYTV